MAHVTFDTLKFVETLQDAGISSVQAKAMSTAIRDAQEIANLATKADLRELKSDIKVDVSNAKSDIIKWLAGLLLAQAALVATLIKLL